MTWKTDFDEKIDNILKSEIGPHRSGPADAVYNLLLDAFPHNRVGQEHFCWYKDTRLFFDFHIKELNLLFEVQGQQHYSFIEHFHGDQRGFIESKKRDNFKREYCQENNWTLVEIKYNEIPETADDLLEIINRALEESSAAN